MIIDKIDNYINKDFFAIIIGSGPAGITLALELEKKKITSLIIESGKLSQKKEDIEFLRGNVIGDNYGNLAVSRLRQFGGASGHWGGNCNPMNIENFFSWPIKKEELDIYNPIAKKILNLNYKENFYNKSFSSNLNVYNILWSNVKFGKKYFNHIKNSKYIYLSLNTRCKNLNGSNKKIKYIDCVNHNNAIKLKSKYYVLSAGGIENSKIMLWSNVLNKGLFNANMPIGKYYMDHPYHNIGEGLVFFEPLKNYFEKKKISNLLNISCSNSLYLCGTNNFINLKGITNSGIYLYFDTKDTNDILNQVRCLAPKFINNIYESYKIKKKFKVTISIMQEQKPIVNNMITLDKKKDPDNIPYPLIYWKKSQIEKKSAKILAEEVSDIFIKNDIGRISLIEHLFNEKNYDAILGNHQLGGTRIGTNIKDSVVDKNLKVHDKENLFIVGSSVFRTSGHNHPTYTIIKLSAKLAEHLSNLKN